MTCKSADSGERSAGDHLALVGRDHDVVHLAVCLRVPVEQGTVGGVERCQPVPGYAVGSGEVAAHVYGVGGDGDGAHGGVEVGCEGGDQGAGTGAVGGDPVTGRSVGGRELAADVDAGSVR